MGTRVSAPFSVVAIHDGERGPKGEDGKGGPYTEIAFSLSAIGSVVGGSSAHCPPDCVGWDAALPAPTAAKPYVWMRSIPMEWNDETGTYVAGTATYTCITGRQGFNGDDALVASLDDDMTMVICDADGTPPSAWTWTTNARLYYGTEAETLTSATATINGVTTGKATMTIATDRKSATLTVRNLVKADADVLKVVVSLTSENGTRVCTATVAKSRRSEVYQLRPAVDVIKADKDDVRTPSVFLEVGAVKISDGTVSDVVMIGSGVKVMAKYSKDGGTTWRNCSRQIISGAILDNYGVPLTGNETSLKLRLLDNTDGSIYDEEDIPVVSDGKDGEPGAPGPRGYEGLIMRVSEWETGKYYRNDENVYDEHELSEDGHRYLDIVSVTNTATDTAEWFLAKEGHNGLQSMLSNKPGSGQRWTTCWSAFDIQNYPVMTPLLYAQRALIEYLQTKQILLMNTSFDKVMGGIGYADGDDAGDMVFPLWFGGETALDPNTNFYVDVNGRMFCMGADIHGNVTIKDEDGVVVYDSEGNERVRMSTRDVTKPKEDKEYPLLDYQSVSLYDVGTDAVVWQGNEPIARRDGASGFDLGEGQSISGRLVYSLRDRIGVAACVDLDGPSIDVKLTLRTADTVLAECTEVFDLSRGEEFDNYWILDIEDTDVGKYVGVGDQHCYLYAELTLHNISADNFSIYGTTGNSASLGVYNFYVNVAHTKTTIAPNGLCVNAGANRHILMDGDGILLRWMNSGIRLDNTGIKKMVNGVWTDL